MHLHLSKLLVQNLPPLKRHRSEPYRTVAINTPMYIVYIKLYWASMAFLNFTTDIPDGRVVIFRTRRSSIIGRIYDQKVRTSGPY